MVTTKPPVLRLYHPHRFYMLVSCIVDNMGRLHQRNGGRNSNSQKNTNSTRRNESCCMRYKCCIRKFQQTLRIGNRTTTSVKTVGGHFCVKIYIHLSHYRTRTKSVADSLFWRTTVIIKVVTITIGSSWPMVTIRNPSLGRISRPTPPKMYPYHYLPWRHSPRIAITRYPFRISIKSRSVSTTT